MYALRDKTLATFIDMVRSYIHLGLHANKQPVPIEEWGFSHVIV